MESTRVLTAQEKSRADLKGGTKRVLSSVPSADDFKFVICMN